MNDLIRNSVLLIIVLAIVFPGELSTALYYAWLWLITRILNYYLMLSAYVMYRRLRADFVKMGLSMPDFKFIPIWERNASK